MLACHSDLSGFPLFQIVHDPPWGSAQPQEPLSSLFLEDGLPCPVNGALNAASLMLSSLVMPSFPFCLPVSGISEAPASDNQVSTPHPIPALLSQCSETDFLHIASDYAALASRRNG